MWITRLIILISLIAFACKKEESKPEDNKEPEDKYTVAVTAPGSQSIYDIGWETSRDTTYSKELRGDYSRGFKADRVRVAIVPRGVETRDPSREFNIYLICDGDTIDRDRTIWSGDEASVTSY